MLKYTYNTTSGKLSQRNLPTVSSNNIRTTYAYDAAGRLEYETVTREAGGTTNLSRTQYAYAYIAAGSGGGRSLTRTEQSWDALGSAWVNDNKVAYTWNGLEWMRYEQRHDWVSSAWSAVYDVAQEYDKNGNRTRYHKNVQGLTADYGSACDLTYGFDGRNFLNTISDADTAGYSCAVTCDLNNNITEVIERRSGQGGTPENNFLYTYFEYDDLNRLTEHKTKQYSGLLWFWTKREHGYDALGRAAASAYIQWPDGSPEPGGTFLEHVYDQSGRHLQNYDGTSSYGAVWHWAGTEPMPNTAGPLRSPNADTASQVAYNDANNVTPQRRTYLNPTTEGDERNEWGQGRPQAKDASGSGANWATGTLSQPQNGNMNVVESRLMFDGTVAANDLSRATDAREKGRIGIFGTGLSYAGSYGRVTSETLGRDLNPLGRGDGNAFVAGWLNLGRVSPVFPKASIRAGVGNSVNNGCCDTELMMPASTQGSKVLDDPTNFPSLQFVFGCCTLTMIATRVLCTAAVAIASILALALALAAFLGAVAGALALMIGLAAACEIAITKAAELATSIIGSLSTIASLIALISGAACLTRCGQMNWDCILNCLAEALHAAWLTIVLAIAAALALVAATAAACLYLFCLLGCLIPEAYWGRCDDFFGPDLAAGQDFLLGSLSDLIDIISGRKQAEGPAWSM